MTDPRTEPKPKSKSKSTSKTTSKKRSPKQPNDYSIWLSMDGIRLSAPWRLRSYGDDGALSESDLSELAERFDLPTSLLETLSQQLGYCLDTDSEVNLVEVKRSKAIERANQELARALKLVEKIEVATVELTTLLEPLSSKFTQSKKEAALLLATKTKAKEVCASITATGHDIKLIMETPGAAAVMNPRNKVRVWDKRRQHVVETCCYAWQDAGRPVTLTTKSDEVGGKKRGGVLYDFIQAIVVRLTDPVRDLPGETIRKDLDRFKDNQAKPDELTTPPDRGIDAIR